MTKDGSTLDKDLIRELAGLLEETGLTEIEFELEGRRFRVARGVNLTTTLTTNSNGIPAAPHDHHESKPRSAQSDDAAVQPGSVTSPMVGTAYRSPEPGAPPFVEIGTRVAAGQTLLIIEAMKTMNQIPSPKAGVVIAILIEDGQPVEYGEPLVVIEQR
ncbi:MAG TPA: acetyl-CoA carboxylase biotin carboxyl carrier protein [Methyloceanibacter sp.]|nr:acetyl-CoA carboxylase biotin carboxyl carrier protein [Methyloceanibacter sp.]